MPGARRATKQLLCAVRLRLRDQAGETGERRGVRRGAQGEAAIWQVQQADPERSTRTAELQAPRAGPADIRARRSRPPASAPADWRSRGPARPCRPGASPRSALSSPWPRPAVSPHLLRAEPGAGEARLGTRRQRGLRPCARGSRPGLLRPRSSARGQLQPPGSSRRVEARKQAKSLPGARGASARTDELPSGRCPSTSGPCSPLGGERRDDVATRRRERWGSVLGPNPRGRQKLGKAAGPTPPQGTRLRLNPGGAAPGLAEWHGCAGGGRGASRCLPSGMLNRGAY